MTKVLDRATAHFRSKLTSEMNKVHVPEWETDIWFKATNTLKEEAKMIELAQAGKTVEALVETLIIRARNEDGSKMFNTLDKTVMMNEVDPAVLIRVVGEINNFAEQIKQEDILKN